MEILIVLLMATFFTGFISASLVSPLLVWITLWITVKKKVKDGALTKAPSMAESHLVIL